MRLSQGPAPWGRRATQPTGKEKTVAKHPAEGDAGKPPRKGSSDSGWSAPRGLSKKPPTDPRSGTRASGTDPKKGDRLQRIVDWALGRKGKK